MIRELNAVQSIVWLSSTQGWSERGGEAQSYILELANPSFLLSERRSCCSCQPAVIVFRISFITVNRHSYS